MAILKANDDVERREGVGWTRGRVVVAGCSSVQVLPIVVGNLMLFLLRGVPLQDRDDLQVVYVEQDGRSDVQSIAPLPAAREMS